MTRKDIIDTEVRTPAENARSFLTTLCVSFTIMMVVCMALGTIFAGEESKQGIMYCWSLLGACVCTAALQFVFFTPTVIKRMAYPLRLFLFGICLYAVLAVLAVVMRWFPADMAGAWVSFTISYLVALAVATAAYAAKHRREERTLNEKLNEYRRNNS